MDNDLNILLEQISESEEIMKVDGEKYLKVMELIEEILEIIK